MQDRIFYTAGLGFILGVFLRSFISLDFYSVILTATISFFVFLLFLLLKNKFGIILSIFILTFSVGALRFSVREMGESHWYDGALGLETSFDGVIVDEPDIRESNQKLTVLNEVSGTVTKILVTTSLGQEFKYGDEVEVKGKIEKPENFTTDQGKEFDYVNYLRKDGILYVVNYGDIEILSHGHGNAIKSALFTTKRKFLEKMNFAIATPENLLMGGLILGEKSSFDQGLRQNFIDTGTIHIVALSGYNVTIVAEWVMKLFKNLPYNFGIFSGILTIFLFIIMTGGASTAIRAGVMATLVLVARATGRTYDAARALLLAAVIMIALNPLTLVYDVSFQLSFIATVAVIFFTPKIEKYFLWVTPRFGLRDIVSVTSAAYIFVLPFILYKMGNLSIVALPANILVLPFISSTMLLGFLTGFTGLIWYALAVPMGFLSYMFLHYELAVISFFAHLPFASLQISNFPLWLTTLIYAYFIYRLFGRAIKKFFIFDGQ